MDEHSAREAWTDRPLVQSIVAAAPSMAVMIAVLILLRGFHGTGVALRLQLATFAESFFGGSNELLLVTLHTLPLALSAAVAVFAVARKWITFESPWSLVALAAIVWAGASVGGCLRGWAPRSWLAATQSTPAPRPADSQDSGATPLPGRDSSILPATKGVQFPLSPPSESPNRPRTRIHSALSRAEAPSPSFELALSAPQRNISGSASGNQAFGHTPSGHGLPEESLSERLDPSAPRVSQIWERLNWDPPKFHSQPDTIQPAAIVPKTGGMFTIIAIALNQLLGYLIAYQPRLFFAAILGGGWLGWVWHQRIDKLRTYTRSGDGG